MQICTTEIENLARLKNYYVEFITVEKICIWLVIEVFL